jgi:hypothetical protein
MRWVSTAFFLFKIQQPLLKIMLIKKY